MQVNDMLNRGSDKFIVQYSNVGPELYAVCHIGECTFIDKFIVCYLGRARQSMACIRRDESVARYHRKFNLTPYIEHARYNNDPTRWYTIAIC